jgi:hypothetical protein
MYLVESETLASKLPDVQELVRQVDSRLVEMDPNAVLRPAIWASFMGTSAAILGAIFDEHVALGVLQGHKWLECKCGNLRPPDRLVSACSNCERKLPDPKVETEVDVYTISPSTRINLLRIQGIKSKLTQSRVIKILVVSANPGDASFLRVDREYKELCEVVGSDAEIKVEFAVAFGRLQELILKHRPDVLHLSLHGIKDDSLVFESEGGKIERVSHADFISVLSLFKDQLLCLVLSSCYSQHVGEQLTDVVPIVVAMRRAIGDMAAITFSKSFYQALDNGKSLKQAFDYAVIAMKANAVGDEDIPSLLVQRGIEASTVFLNRKGPQ